MELQSACNVTDEACDTESHVLGIAEEREQEGDDANDESCNE